MGKKHNCNPYAGGKIPPCSDFLGNAAPIIKNGKLIYRNFNRIFYFLSTAPNNNSNTTNNIVSVSTNLQISLSTFILGLYINLIQLNLISYNKNSVIHSNKNANKFIHETLQTPPKITLSYIPSLSLTISNGNAIASLYTSTINITPVTYYILLVINRFEGNPSLFFGNNSHALEEPINLDLAALNLNFPFQTKNCGS